MKKEISAGSVDFKGRIKELKEKITRLQGANNEIIQQGQILQQKIANNNTEILKCQGGIEELEKSLK